MATAGVPTWSKTAATNSTADPAVNWAEGQAPSSVNDSARALMASVAKWRDDISGSLTTAGTSTAYTLTTNSTYASASAMDKMLITFIPHTTSGAAPTLAVDGLTARAINTATGVAVSTGALVSGTPYTVVFINASTEFILIGQLGALGTTSFTSIKTDDGTVGAPAQSWLSDTDSGAYRIGANNIGYAVNGAKVLDIGTAGLVVTGTASSTGVNTASGFKVGANATATPGKTPTTQEFLSSSGTYVSPAGVAWIKARVIAGGGGGAGTAGSAGSGAASSFNGIIANGGAPGVNGSGSTGGIGGAGGSGGAGTANLRCSGQRGGDGGFSSNSSSGNGGEGGSGPFGGGGASSNTTGRNAETNSGGGGSGAGNNGYGSGGGGCGEYFELILAAGSYTYEVGAAGTPATNGGSGAAGRILVEEYYS